MPLTAFIVLIFILIILGVVWGYFKNKTKNSSDRYIFNVLMVIIGIISIILIIFLVYTCKLSTSKNVADNEIKVVSSFILLVLTFVMSTLKSHFFDEYIKFYKFKLLLLIYLWIEGITLATFIVSIVTLNNFHLLMIKDNIWTYIILPILLILLLFFLYAMFVVRDYKIRMTIIKK